MADRIADCILDERTRLGWIELEHAREVEPRGRIDAVDAIDLLRPDGLEGRKIDLPTADAGHRGDRIEQALTSAQLRLRGFGPRERRFERRIHLVRARHLRTRLEAADGGALLPDAEDGDGPDREDRECAMAQDLPGEGYMAVEQPRDREGGAEARCDPGVARAGRPQAREHDGDVGNADARPERDPKVGEAYGEGETEDPDRPDSRAGIGETRGRAPLEPRKLGLDTIGDGNVAGRHRARAGPAHSRSQRRLRMMRSGGRMRPSGASQAPWRGVAQCRAP